MSARSLDDADEEGNMLDVSEIGMEWEKEGEIRAHLRSDPSAVLFVEGVNESVKACSVPHVFELLKVLATRTAAKDCHPQAPVQDLRQELTTLYQRCGVMPTDSAIFNDSWAIRKFMSFLKMKVRKRKVSTVTCFNICMIKICVFFFGGALHPVDVMWHIISVKYLEFLKAKWKRMWFLPLKFQIRHSAHCPGDQVPRTLFDSQPDASGLMGKIR